jgi:anti-anti-sigma regulatory factor
LPYLCLPADTMKADNRIYYAEDVGNYCLRFVGDVRVTFCVALSSYLDRLFITENIESVVVDLKSAKALDSTTLGFLAKLALFLNNKRNLQPLLIVDDPSMIRLLESMGIDELFSFVSELPENVDQVKELPFTSASTDEARLKVIEAHKILMGMNIKNMNTFSELVKSLEGEGLK